MEGKRVDAIDADIMDIQNKIKNEMAAIKKLNKDKIQRIEMYCLRILETEKRLEEVTACLSACYVHIHNSAPEHLVRRVKAVLMPDYNPPEQGSSHRKDNYSLSYYDIPFIITPKF